jgi:hypothetical protein
MLWAAPLLAARRMDMDSITFPHPLPNAACPLLRGYFFFRSLTYALRNVDPTVGVPEWGPALYSSHSPLRFL